MVRLADEIRKRLAALRSPPPITSSTLERVGYDYFAELAGSHNFGDRRPTPRGHARVRRDASRSGSRR